MEPKKRSVGASERDEFLRAAWRVMVAERIDAGRFVFVDECGANTSLSPLYAWAPKGQRARSSVPRNLGANITLLASITADGIGPSLAVEGATTREVFEAYLERLLVPSLRPGQVVVMDNLSVHKGGRVRELIEERGCELLYLPPYSPDFNPIEEINSAYRRLSAATEDLVRADRELAEYIRRVRLDNAEAILEAKNERTASLYLDGLLDTDELAAWRPSGRGRSSTTSTQGAKWTGCT